MIEVGSYEAKTHLSRLLDQVVRGERITITRHGIPIAILSPVMPGPKKPVQEAIDGIKKFRKGHSLSGLKLQDLIREGRR